MNWITDLIERILDLFRKPHIIPPFLKGSPDWVQPPVDNVSQDWLKYLSQPYRKQIIGFVDEANCATRAAIYCIEAILNYYIQNNLFPENVSTFLKKYYYNELGYVRLSIRFNSKMNHTTSQGQEMGVVLSSFAKDGLVPEWVYPDPPQPFTWEQYYADVPDGIEQYGELSTTFFKILWEVVWNNNWNTPDISKIRNILKSSPVYIGGKIGNMKDGIEVWQGIKHYEHCRVIYAEDNYQEILDSYTSLDFPELLRKMDVAFPVPTTIQLAVKII